MVSKDNLQQLTFYVVVNSDNEYFRRKGYRGTGDSWVKEIEKARMYTKLGQARSIVTFFANNYPDYPAPCIIKMVGTATEVLDEADRIAKAKAKKQKKKEEAEIRLQEYRLQKAQEDLERARKNLEDIKRKKK